MKTENEIRGRIASLNEDIASSHAIRAQMLQDYRETLEWVLAPSAAEGEVCECGHSYNDHERSACIHDERCACAKFTPRVAKSCETFGRNTDNDPCVLEIQVDECPGFKHWQPKAKVERKGYAPFEDDSALNQVIADIHARLVRLEGK